MKRRPISLTALRAFEAAARLGSMSGASRELSVTHGAVSRQVQHLEKVLNVELFAGPRTRPELTSAGRELLAPLTVAFDQIDAALRAVAQYGDAVLDVSCLSTFLMRWLIPRLHRFREAYPQIDVRLLASSQDGPGQARFDLAILIEEGRGPADRSSILFDEWLGPVVSPGFSGGRQLHSVADLLSASLIQTATRLDAWATWSQGAGGEPVRPAGAVFEHYYYTLEAASAGLGVCIAPWHLVVSEIQSGRLIAPFGFVRSGFYYAVRTQLATRLNVERFRKWLLAEASAMPQPG